MRQLIWIITLFLLSCVPPAPSGWNFFAQVQAVKLPSGIALGSAVIVRSYPTHTILATALHVIEEAVYIQVKHRGYNYDATPLVYNKYADLVLLRIEKTLPAPTIATTFPQPGTSTYALGPSPFGTILLTGVLASNEAKCPTGRGSCAITSTPSGPGFSGAPIFTQDNELIGIILGYTTRPPVLTFFTTSSQINAMLFLLDSIPAVK